MCSSSEVLLPFAFPKLSETSCRIARYNAKQSETPAVLLEQAKIWVKEQGTTAINLFPLTVIDILFVTVSTATLAALHSGHLYNKAIILRVAKKICKTDVIQSRLLLPNPQVWESFWFNFVTAMGNTSKAKKEREVSHDVKLSLQLFSDL